MKTLTYLPTLLALTIQVMVNGQTPDSQVRKIRADIMDKTQSTRTNDTTTITISLTEYRHLLEQANYSKYDAEKAATENITGDQQSLVKQIKVSEEFAKISKQKFAQNREVIFDLLNKTPKNNYTYVKAQSSNTEAEYLMKMAQEMREEANAQFTLQARLGDMSNAEEKEELALNKQKEAIDLFKNNYPQLLQNVQVLVYQQAISVDAKIENSDKSRQEVSIAEKSELLNDLLKQIRDMKATAKELRATAVNYSPNERDLIINEAVSLEGEALLKQIEASELRANLNYQNFYQNRTAITLLIQNAKGNQELVSKAAQLSEEADRLLKIGKEMREEANAQFSNAARYGEMSNAEETELVAMNKQEQSMQVIQKVESKMTIAIK